MSTMVTAMGSRPRAAVVGGGGERGRWCRRAAHQRGCTTSAIARTRIVVGGLEGFFHRGAREQRAGRASSASAAGRVVAAAGGTDGKRDVPALSLDLDMGEFQAEWDLITQGGEAARADDAAFKKRQSRMVDWELESGDMKEELCYLVGSELKERNPKVGGFTTEESLRELAQLADTAGLVVVGQTVQRMQSINPKTYIGSGKVEELFRDVARLGVDTVIFDDELSPTQGRNLEKLLLEMSGVPVQVCDRTNLILDIFSQRANTAEGKLQVQLAMAEYQLPRLTRMWSHLERQSGGGQVKGMGETQIEIDKRLLREQIQRLKLDLENVRVHRAQYRIRRAKVPLPVVAIVGYTNAGKSTLMNRLTNAEVLAEDKLFATLDPTTRRVVMPTGKELLLTDTVGFIQKLPTELVAAFRATLEEVAEASVLLHVVDASSPRAVSESEAVRDILKDMEVSHIPVITVWNKLDAASTPDILREVAATRQDTFCISAHTGDGLDDLLAGVENMLQRRMVELDVLIPYTDGSMVGELHKVAVVHEEEFTEDGTRIHAHVPVELASRIHSLTERYDAFKIYNA